MDKNIFNTVIAATGTVLTWLFGTWDMALIVLITAMSLDYIMGIMCGYKDKSLSSSTGFKGLTKKFTILIILILAVCLDRLIGQGWVFRTLVIYFYVAIEGISILENAVKLGLEVPDALKDALIQLKQGNKKEIKEQDK
ncbi:phage holin family protein [Clostridium massiliodielmoense]|uniref:phage holin family protein n=1 Tax=Clostridium massiliodielmoense TaxID=1776385 RepID=UPI000A26DDD7|nr:phage holin family protein [Clostridium massiliodielmoense]